VNGGRRGRKRKWERDEEERGINQFIGLTYSLGVTLQQQAGAVFHVTASTRVDIVNTFNVFCLTKHGNSLPIT
jgi:hypothetical protein